jgi:hypothetical protein
VGRVVLAKYIKPGKVKSVRGCEPAFATTGRVTADGAREITRGITRDVAADNDVNHLIDRVVRDRYKLLLRRKPLEARETTSFGGKGRRRSKVCA